VAHIRQDEVSLTLTAILLHTKIVVARWL
jgi:hypothetical protein